MLDGRHLVIGTPCEIAAMRNVIEARGVSDRYVLVDLICHGVPSAHLYRKQLSEFRGKRHDADSPIEVRFRNKLDGSWRDWTLYLECEETSCGFQRLGRRSTPSSTRETLHALLLRVSLEDGVSC